MVSYEETVLHVLLWGVRGWRLTFFFSQSVGLAVMFVLMVLPLVLLSVAAVGGPGPIQPRVVKPPVPSMAKPVEVLQKEHQEGQTHSHAGYSLDMMQTSRPLPPASGPAAPSTPLPLRGVAPVEEDQTACTSTAPTAAALTGSSGDASRDAYGVEGMDVEGMGVEGMDEHGRRGHG